MTDFDRLQALPEEQPSVQQHDNTTPACTGVGRCTISNIRFFFDLPNH